MCAAWWISIALFGILSLASLVVAALALKEGKVDYRAYAILLVGIGAITWCISAKKHPEEWLDVDGKAKRSFRIGK